MDNSELPEKINPSSPDFRTELASKIADIAPEIISDGKLDIAKLRELVNGDVETVTEKFGLFWPGKARAQAVAQIPTSATLIPVPDESVDWDNTKNIFIEGDNLEVLKALQNSYRRKIKMIYIDPPYNTDQDFVYPDKFSEGLQGYLEYTGQKNEDGEKTESKSETGGRKHSNWLSMMYPRLQLAKSLLSDNGVLFCSINEIEYSNLKSILSEIFGEENYIQTLKWKRKKQPSYLHGHVASVMEYVIIYARDAQKLEKLSVSSKTDETTRLDNASNEISTRLFKAGVRVKANVVSINKGEYKIKTASIEYLNDIVVKNGKTANDVTVRARFRNSQVQIDNFIDNELLFITNNLGLRRDNSEEDKEGRKMITDLLLDWGDNQDSDKEMNILFPEGKPFDYPKPTSLIYNLAKSNEGDNFIVMDFFSGSATTADAIMRLNADDDGTRVHIQVQLPELLNVRDVAYVAGYKTIADISKERIRRAGKKVRKDNADKIAQRTSPLDTGFRVYKLAPSNFVLWDENEAKNDIQQAVLDFASNKKSDAAPEALLTEIMLQARIPLNAKIEKRELSSGSWVYVVDGGNLIAYVANEPITEDQAREIADKAPAKLVILDSAFNGNDALKINIKNICKEKFIKEFKTI